MGLHIDTKKAESVFAQALDLARATTPLPAEWLERTRKVASARSKTFTPALGTALLAKATDRRIDAFSLREGKGHKSYSARGLAKEVLVPQCVLAGVDIRTTGPEPLNNQPFFHAERIAPALNVRPNVKTDLLYLCECIERVDFLEDEHALRALAAFLRARLEASAPPAKIEIGARQLSVGQIESAIDAFVGGDSEGGKTGQALAAAILDLVFADVRTKRINDPSVKWPGDVGIFGESGLVEAVEVRQKPVSATDVLLFAQRLSAARLGRGIVLAFGQAVHPLEIEVLRRHARDQYNVELAVFLTAGGLFREAIRWAPRDVAQTVLLLPTRGLARLEAIEASAKSRTTWAMIFAD